MNNHYRCCWNVYLRDATFSEHMRQEHGLSLDDLVIMPAREFSTATMRVRVSRLVNRKVHDCYYVEAFHNSQNGDLRSKEMKE